MSPSPSSVTGIELYAKQHRETTTYYSLWSGVVTASALHTFPNGHHGTSVGGHPPIVGSGLPQLG